MLLKYYSMYKNLFKYFLNTIKKHFKHKFIINEKFKFIKY